MSRHSGTNRKPHRIGAAALVVVALLALAVPVVVDAAGRAPAAPRQPLTTPLGKNLLQNGSFEWATNGTSIPGWTASGDLHVETFGTRNWPSPAYSRKYDGGKQYLICGPGSGEVRQTVAINGLGGRKNTDRLKSRLSINFGGAIGHKIRAEIRITGAPGQASHREQVYVLPITDSYKRVVVTLLVRNWARHIEVTAQLLPDNSGSKCHVVADSASLTIFRP